MLEVQYITFQLLTIKLLLSFYWQYPVGLLGNCSFTLQTTCRSRGQVLEEVCEREQGEVRGKCQVRKERRKRMREDIEWMKWRGKRDLGSEMKDGVEGIGWSMWASMRDPEDKQIHLDKSIYFWREAVWSLLALLCLCYSEHKISTVCPSL